MPFEDLFMILFLTLVLMAKDEIFLAVLIEEKEAAFFLSFCGFVLFSHWFFRDIWYCLYIHYYIVPTICLMPIGWIFFS